MRLAAAVLEKSKTDFSHATNEMIISSAVSKAKERFERGLGPLLLSVTISTGTQTFTLSNRRSCQREKTTNVKGQ